MDRSDNFNFYLPSSNDDDVAEVDRISDNFRAIDEKLAVDDHFSQLSERPIQNKVVSEFLQGVNEQLSSIENLIPVVDSALDFSSENPVQNKVVAKEVQNLSSGLGVVNGNAQQANNTAEEALVVANEAKATSSNIGSVLSRTNERVTTLENSVVLFTEQTLTEEQKAQARENIGAVAEDETFDRAEGETIVGKNLFNTNAVAPDPNDPYSGGFWRGKLFSDDGTISSNIAACITDFIPVRQGSALYFSSSATGEWTACDARRVMGYDENKNIIGLVASSRQNATTTQLAGVSYVRIQFTTANADADCQVEYGSRTTYEPYTETVVPGSVTLKPECLPEEFDELNKEVENIKNAIGGDTLAIDKARFDSRFNYIAYSEINGRAAPNNTLSHFNYCVKQGFTALKGDMRITADGKLVMCHDAGFTLDENGDIITFNKNNVSVLIRDLTEAECFALTHSGRTDSVCGFETYIKLCKKYGKIAYITIREEYVDEVVPEMMRILRKYSMVKQCIVSGYPYNTPLQAVREADPTIMLAWVLGQNVDITTEHIDYAVSMGNMLICGFHFSSASNDVATKLAGSLAAIEYAHEKDIRVYEAQVCSMEQADQMMDYGVMGAQMRVAPTFE